MLDDTSKNILEFLDNIIKCCEIHNVNIQEVFAKHPNLSHFTLFRKCFNIPSSELENIIEKLDLLYENDFIDTKMDSTYFTTQCIYERLNTEGSKSFLTESGKALLEN